MYVSLSKLEFFLIYNNPIEKLPGTIIKMTRVTDIDASNTLLEELPAAINQLENLSLLFLPNTISFEERKRLMKKLGSCNIRYND